jgi:SNF2 family DNA or RNA helicase
MMPLKINASIIFTGFYLANSVEERIIELQKQKKSIATEVLCDKKMTEDAGSGAKTTLEDFKTFFVHDGVE